ncbi:MAG: 3-hydroxyacyl-CoA dehydrogenase NAD-binding domain-containing protein [marine benthic group bacterium]|nr:3-hydroxyacyl-CoA dehydrogenase NAD-binding domain-containing protein [Gemmatimonadota bacterium]
MNAPTSESTSGLGFEVDRDHVGWLTFDRPDASTNLLTPTLMQELDALLSQLESRIANGQILALVLRSGKEGSFIAGADVEAIAALSSAADARAASAEGQRIFRRIERLRVPTVAAVDGACMGGGTELILHCDYRVASDRNSTVIGLPEVRLGILPGFGGTVKLPPLVGMQNALGIILSGKPVRPSRAKRLGLIDEVVAAARFRSAVSEFVARVIGNRVERTPPALGFGQRLLERTGPGRRIMFGAARKRTSAEVGAFYPAPFKAIDVLAGAVGMKADEAYASEAAALGDLAVTPESRNLVRVFRLSQAARRALPEDVAPHGRSVNRMGVIGAGMMGGAIAELAAAHDIPVVLKDIDQDALDSGLRHAGDLLRKAVAARVFSEEEASLKFALITGTLEYDDFEGADLVVEAVVERMAVKQQVLREAEASADGAVLATNTSALSVDEMASGVERPGSVIGLHFFNPVHKMPLVEVVAGPRTSPEALATGFGLVLALGKTPVLVADRPGFLVNRLLAPYLNEAGFLLEEGASIEAVDGALESFGMPMGPLRLLDEIGFDVARHASREMAAAFGERMRPSGVLDRMIEDARLGRKNGLGFHRYQDGRDRGADPTVPRLLSREEATGPGAARSSFPAEEIQRRCLYIMVNEAAYALEEQVVEGPDPVDLAMVMGTGFPPFRGGLLRWADVEDIRKIHNALSEYAGTCGNRFAPAPLLVRMAEQNRTFTDLN